MNSIEITNAINKKGFNEPTPAEAAEAKAKHWIRLGVKAALAEAVTFAKCDLEFAETADVVDEPLVHELTETIRILSGPTHEDYLVNRGWGLRK
jgi:uncharacterized protein YdaT